MEVEQDGVKAKPEKNKPNLESGNISTFLLTLTPGVSEWSEDDSSNIWNDAKLFPLAMKCSRVEKNWKNDPDSISMHG